MFWLTGSETRSIRESTLYQQALQTKELLALLAGPSGSIGSATQYVHTARKPRDCPVPGNSAVLVGHRQPLVLFRYLKD